MRKCLTFIALCFGLLLPAGRSFDTPARAQTPAPPIAPTDAAKPMAGMGIMAGEVTDQSVLVQLRLTQNEKLVDGDVRGAWGIVEFNLRSPQHGDAEQSKTVHALPERDYIARAGFSNLRPNANYVCTTRLGSSQETLAAGPQLEFRTNPGPAIAAPVRFVVVTGMNYAKFHGDERIDRELHLRNNNTELPKPYAGADKALGYPALATILKLKPNFFVGTGDNVYYDTPTDPRAQTVREMRRKWHEQFVQPRYQSLFAKVPTYWMVDDHDYRIDDCDNSGEYLPLPETGRRVLLEQLPYATMESPAAKTYRTQRVSRDLQIWLTDNRFYRSPNSMSDGPQKTIWGVEQREWLQRTLLASDAKFKLLISPTPMIGPDDLRKKDNHCDIGGFRHERDEFFKFLKANKLDRNCFIVCGDRHWQYHAVDSSGIEEFSCGALVDANSRLGRMPGDPEGTDPEGLIKHLHQQHERSAGFLMISCAAGDTDRSASLDFEFFDEHGASLYKHTKL